MGNVGAYTDHHTWMLSDRRITENIWKYWEHPTKKEQFRTPNMHTPILPETNHEFIPENCWLEDEIMWNCLPLLWSLKPSLITLPQLHSGSGDASQSGRIQHIFVANDSVHLRITTVILKGFWGLWALEKRIPKGSMYGIYLPTLIWLFLMAKI